MSFILGIFFAFALIGLIVFFVKLSAHRKNRSVRKWLSASFLLPFLPFVLFFMPPYAHKKDKETDSVFLSSRVPPHILRFGEYIGIFLIALLEIFLIWSFNSWLSKPWDGGDSAFVYDKRLAEKPSAETRQSAHEFLEAFFQPEMTGAPISMPPFKAEKTLKHCFSLCGYSGVCDQIKLRQCVKDYKISYQSVAHYLQQNYPYPWTKTLVKYLARQNDREGVLNYTQLSRQLLASQAAFEKLQKQYKAHKVDTVLLARAIQDSMQATGAPDFVKSEVIYRQELRFYR